MKLLIVEDEPPIARMLGKMIHTLDKEIEIIGMARNGKEALRILNSERPDVIFTDIRMPVMGGLELLSEVQKKNEGIKFVILSGYQEFEYARKAIQLNATDYLLKPVSEEMLGTVLEKLRESVSEDKTKARDEITAKIYDKYRVENTEILPGRCTLGLLCFGSLPLVEDENMFPGSCLWGKLGLDEEVFQLLERKTLTGTFWQIPGFTSAEQIIIYERKKADEIGEEQLMHQIYKIACKKIRIPVTMISMKEEVDISSVGAAHLQMRKELFNKILYGKSAFFQMGGKESAEAREIKEGLAFFVEACGEGDSDLVEKRKKEFFALCKDYPVRQKQFQRYMERLVTYECEFYRLPLEDQEQIEIPAILSNLSGIGEVEKEIDAVFSRMRRNIEIKVRHPRLMEVKRYIEENYKMQLTNEEIAGEFGFATVYLGKIFKETYGVTMGQYLIQLKISEAKQLMKENPNMLLKEIASTVGYPDPYYFSKVFKKKTGIWPSQYRKR